MSKREIVCVDLFCGAGGLSIGLKDAGINIAAGFDFDPACEYPYKENIGADFICKDIREIKAEEIEKYYPQGSLRLLAGCAPCQPFSMMKRGADTSSDEKWGLLLEFARLVEEIQPDFITMENVPGLSKQTVFDDFVTRIEKAGYQIKFDQLYGPDYGLPQNRKRLVLIGSKIGEVELPKKTHIKSNYRTVREIIANLPVLNNGESAANDPLHIAAGLTEINLKRIKFSKPGGSWEDWPLEYRAKCHVKASGSTFKSVYARMGWDKPSPTITTQFYNFGTGRFGHPEQHRAITPREAAMLQSFPETYKFVPPDSKVQLSVVSRLIGNAVPPILGKVIGESLTSIANKGI